MNQQTIKNGYPILQGAYLRLLLLFLNLFAIDPIIAQPPTFYFEKMQSNEGIDIRRVHSIVQDSFGFMWFGSSQGLYRYDGDSFRHFHKINRNHYIPFINVNVKLGREPGELILHDYKKVVVFNYLHSTFDTLSIDKSDIEISIKITSLQIDVNGTLWILAHASNHHLSNQFLFNSTDFKTFNLVKKITSKNMSALEIGYTGILVCLDESILEIDPTGTVLREYNFKGRTPFDPYIDSTGVLWVKDACYETPTPQGCEIWFLEPGDSIFKPFPIADGKKISQSRNFWVDDDYLMASVVWRSNLSLIDRKNNELYEFGTETIPIHDFWITSYGLDRSGVRWLGGAYLIKMETRPKINHYLKDHENCFRGVCNIKSIVEAQNGEIYFGHSKGVATLNPKTEVVTSFPSINKTQFAPESITFFNHKVLFDNLLYDPNTKEYNYLKSQSQHYSKAIIDQSGSLWQCIDAFPEIYVYKDFFSEPFKVNVIKEHISKGEYVRYFDILETRNGSFCIITESQGLFYLTKDGALLKRFKYKRHEENSLLSTLNYCIEESESGIFWIGSSMGLSRLDIENNQFKHFRVEDGLQAAPVYSMVVEPQKGLWLGTGNGLSFFDFHTASFLNFSQVDGLKNREYNRNSAIKSKSGRLYFGGLDGVDSFYPEELLPFNKVKKSIPIIVNRFSYFDGDLNQTLISKNGLEHIKTIKLKASDKFFGLRFQLADFRTNAKTFYSYKLEGYDNWSLPNSNNELRYEEIPPGEYLLRVKASLSPGNWNPKEVSIKVVKLQYWYKTWWARTLFGAFILGTFYAFYHFQLKRKLEQQESIRLRELDTLKTRLYTNITHEFRTPLTIILGMIDNIRGFNQERSLIKRNGKNLLRLVNQLLDLSKLDSGSMKMDTIQADVINYLRYLTESFYSLAKERKIELTFTTNLEELIMDFDEGKMQHIVYNLLSNALKFTPEKGKVNFHTEKARKNGQDMLRIKVQDNGIGISEKKFPHIFDRFYQADNSTTRKGEGTGIGLALTNELVQLMNGTISVNSIKGEGTTFTIWLPIQNKAALSKLSSEIEARKDLDKGLIPGSLESTNGYYYKQQATLMDTEKPLLLIIEDNKDVATYTRSILQSQYEIRWVQNGKLGIEQALEIIPDIIICDVMMPEKDGFEVLAALKNEDRTSHIPIILLTAKADYDSKLEGLEGGADAYLAKPFRKEELMIRLEKLIELRKKLQTYYTNPIDHQIPKKLRRPKEDAFLHKAINYIQSNLSDPRFGNAELALKMTMSESQLHRKLKAITGKSLAIFIRSVRLQKGKELLETTHLSVSEIAYELGFADPAYFSRTFSKEFGMPPSKLR